MKINFINNNNKIKLIKLSKKRFLEINFFNSNQTWLLGAIQHRKIGPAVIAKTYLVWSRHGIFHRIDGPSYIDTRINIKEWYYEGNIGNILEQEYWNK